MVLVDSNVHVYLILVWGDCVSLKSNSPFSCLKVLSIKANILESELRKVSLFSPLGMYILIFLFLLLKHIG